MTMQINSTDALAGVSIKQVRGFFRHVVGWHHESFDLGRLREKLSLDEVSAQRLALELVADSYVEPPQNGTYKLTERGHELVRSSAAGIIKRKTAETALTGLLRRVEQYNSDPDKILAIEAVVVFGSFLGTKQKLGDLDVAVKHRDRDTDGDVAERALAYARRSGRTFNIFIDELSWPSTELDQILKARKRTIKIQEWNAFLRLADKGGHSFEYKVVFGDTDRVQAEIKDRIESKRRTEAPTARI